MREEVQTMAGSPRETRPDIYSYLSFRDFLRDCFADRKRRRSGFSYEVFARIAGLKSKATLHNAIHGSRTPRPETVNAIACGLGLGADETAYLQLLVRLDQARTVEDRRQVLEELLGTTRYRQARPLSEAPGLDDFLRRWMCITIRELARLPGTPSDPEALAGRLLYGPAVDDVRDALRVLVALGQVVVREHNLRAAELRVFTGPKVSGDAIYEFYRSFLSLARQALDTGCKQEMHFQAATIVLTPELLEELRAEIGTWMHGRATVADAFDVSRPGARVYQLQVQAFPLSVQPGSPGGGTADGAPAPDGLADG